MTQPVSYVEINSHDLPRPATVGCSCPRCSPGTRKPSPRRIAWPLRTATGRPSTSGVDAGLMASLDGRPRCVPVIRVPDLAAAVAVVRRHGGTPVVAPFTLSGVGSRCYVTDPAGVLIGLHHYDVDDGGSGGP